MIPEPKRGILHFKKTFAIDWIVAMDLVASDMPPCASKCPFPHLNSPWICLKPIGLLALIRHSGGGVAIATLLPLSIVNDVVFCITVDIGASDMLNLDGNRLGINWKLRAIIWVIA